MQRLIDMCTAIRAYRHGVGAVGVINVALSGCIVPTASSPDLNVGQNAHMQIRKYT